MTKVCCPMCGQTEKVADFTVGWGCSGGTAKPHRFIWFQMSTVRDGATVDLTRKGQAA